jgi:hypothetical protein
MNRQQKYNYHAKIKFYMNEGILSILIISLGISPLNFENASNSGRSN